MNTMQLSEELEAMYVSMGLSKEVQALGQEAEAALAERFAEIDRVAQFNQMKVDRKSVV